MKKKIINIFLILYLFVVLLISSLLYFNVKVCDFGDEIHICNTIPQDEIIIPNIEKYKEVEPITVPLKLKESE